MERLQASEASACHILVLSVSNIAQVDEILVTDSIPLTPEKLIPKIQVKSIAYLLGEAIRRIHNEESLSSLFGVQTLNIA